MRRQLKAFGSKLKGGYRQGILQWATWSGWWCGGSLLQEDWRDLMLSSPGPHGGFSATLISAGGTTRPGQKPSQRFLEYVNDNFLTQVIEEPTRKGVMLDRESTNRKELLEYNAPRQLWLQWPWDCGVQDPQGTEEDMQQAHCKLSSLDFRRANFGLFKDLTGRVPWHKALEGRGGQEYWLIFKDHILQDQERCILTRRKLDKNARRPPWMDKKLLSKVKARNEVFRKLKQRGMASLRGIQENCVGS